MKICFYLLLSIWLLAGAKINLAQSNAGPPEATKYRCLPDEIKPDTAVEAKQIKWAGGTRLVKETVAQRLSTMNARCKAGKLLDRKGKEIRFYNVQGCWGNPPADYLEILEAEKRTLRDLRRKFTVIEITCNPSGLAPF